MNENNNGDITDLKNIRNVIERIGKVDLYTGDFGFEVGEDYNKQEENSLIGLRSQIKLGLGLMKKGGSMIIKCFTLFNPKSQLYVSWMYECFEKTYAYKPYTSNDSNSEIYIVGINFIKKVELGKVRRIDLTYVMNVFGRNQIHRINYYEKCLLEKKDIIYPISDKQWLTKFG